MLKIKFWRIENVILMKILEQGDEIERGRFKFKASNGITLASSDNPQIIAERLFIRGKDKSDDENVVACEYTTTETAKELLKNHIEAVKEYNNSLQQPAAEDVEDIETVIAE